MNGKNALCFLPLLFVPGRQVHLVLSRLLSKKADEFVPYPIVGSSYEDYTCGHV
jgi:hypothetical protein